MLKKIYSKNPDDKDIVRIDGMNTLKDLMVMIVPDRAFIKWVGEKRRYKCIARSDNFIIVNKNHNLKKDYDGSPLVMYSIFDLTQMKCNRDNLVFGLYDYGKKEDCAEALKRLETAIIPFEDRFEKDEEETKRSGRGSWKPKYDGADDILEISQRGIANIEDVIEEIWVEMEIRKEKPHGQN